MFSLYEKRYSWYSLLNTVDKVTKYVYTVEQNVSVYFSLGI